MTFEVPQAELQLWNAEKKWVVEPGTYTVWAGDSSQAAPSAKFMLQAAPSPVR
jgi:beta-glucosidase